MKNKIYGVIVFILIMLFIPNVNAYIETTLKYNMTDDENETCDYETSYYLKTNYMSDQIKIMGTSEGIKTLSVKNLKAVGINYNKVQLDFDDVEGATGYQIYRSNKKSSSYKLIGTSETSEYIDDNASVAKTYYYKVRAYNDSTGSKIYSKYSAVKSSKAKLLNPTVNVKDSSYNSIKVSYDKVEGATGYQIYRATSKNGKYSLVKTTTSLSYTDKKLITGKTYYYKVRAYRTISGKKYYSGYSTTRSTKPTVVAPGVTVTNYDYNINKITITSKPAGVTGYAIYRSDSAESEYTLLGTTTKTTYYDKKLETGKTYYYKVRAYRTVSKSKKYGYYTEVMESIPTLRTPNVSITNTTRDSLTLNIDKVNGADGYYVYEIINGIDILLDYTEDTTITYHNLTLGSEHTYKVIAAKINENEHLSLEKIVTETVKPSTIDLSISAEKFHTQVLIASLLEVKATDEAILYVYQATSEDGNYSLVFEGEPITAKTGEYLLNITLDGLRLNTTYYYKTRISINGIMSNMSAVVSKKALTTPNISISDYEYNKITIKTDYDKEIDGYQVYRATSSNGKYTKVYEGTKNDISISATFNKNYYYKIRYYKVYNGKKVYSPYSQIICQKTKLSAPNSLQLSERENGKVKVTFEYVLGATGYAIYRSTDGENYTKIGNTSHSTSYIDSSRTAGMTYYYKVRAYRTINGKKHYSDYSNEKCIEILGNLTTKHVNAIELAQDYLRALNFSRADLISQLEYEGYSNSVATYAVDYLNADWNEQALLTAENYLEVTAFSKIGLSEQLEYEKFTASEIEYAMNNIVVDWNEQALLTAENYLEVTAFSKIGLAEQLEYEKFTASEIEYAMNNIVVDWNEQALLTAQKYLKYFSYTKEELISQLEYEGFDDSEIEYAVENCGRY